MPPLSITFVTSECHPYARTGGLAEVCAALSGALAALGHDVTVILPRFRGIETRQLRRWAIGFRLGSQDVHVEVAEHRTPDDVLMAFVDAPALFDRSGLYGDDHHDYPDNAWRFAVFDRAAIEYVRARGQRPSVIHGHDWQAGLVPAFQKMLFSSDPIVGGVPAVCTIHNLGFQGVFPTATLDSIGLSPEVLHVNAMEYWGQINYLKSGINFSERITTVSPTYAREILTPALGCGLDGVLRRRAGDLTGILNGVDGARWTPSADPFLPEPFDSANLAGKRSAKRALLERAGLAADAAALTRPLIGLLSRMTGQKGFDLLRAAEADLMAVDATWILLGNGDQAYEDQWRALAARYPARVSTSIGFDERFAHLILGGSDLFLMPSQYEPCGLNQMYALRYGTIPVVRSTGGLADTVRDVPAGTANGFTFEPYEPRALVSALRRALEVFGQPAAWRHLQENGMAEVHSWDAAAREYVKVYEASRD